MSFWRKKFASEQDFSAQQPQQGFYIYILLYIYIYIICMYVCVYIYIYIYIIDTEFCNAISEDAVISVESMF